MLLLAKGYHVTASDVHDAWSAWMSPQKPDHESLVRFDDLDPSVQMQDRVYVDAIRSVAMETGRPDPVVTFHKALFPSGPPSSDSEHSQAFELYKIMVESSEELVNRRQSVNTFFLTINGAIFTAAGFVIQSGGVEQLNALAVLVLAVAGAILCLAWCSLITSFGQLNRGKFKVINSLEKHLKASIYAAEWEALERGENPSVYRSFTSREIWVPKALCVVYAIAAVCSLAVVFDFFSLRAQLPPTQPAATTSTPARALAAPIP